ncbi:MAG: hypothetical protein H7Y19_17010 [Luteimonas sp.]|nr:hypothetical protein [Luteimonas sp.]
MRPRLRLFTVKVSGDREASDGGVLREVQGFGVTLKNRWDVQKELADSKLEPALEGFAYSRIDLFAVYPTHPPSRRVAALVDFLAEALSFPTS